MAPRTKLVVAYLGQGFAGWQRQPDRPSVQQALEDAVSRVCGAARVTVVGAGRTDSGVHASGQVAHVDLPAFIPPASLLRAVNGALPPSVRVRRVVEVGADFHARYDAVAKRYVYRAIWSAPSLPWQGLRSAVVRRPRDRRGVEEALALLPGRRDMRSFAPPSEAHRSPLRELFEVSGRWSAHGLQLSFVGDGFLRYQVRRMVGAVLEVGWGRRDVDDLRALLDRPMPGAPVWTAPARGLTLEKVYYRPPARPARPPGGGRPLW